MPAEWEPHDGTWLAWPHRRNDWPGKFGPIRAVYAEIIRALSRTEDVFVVVADRTTRHKATRLLDAVRADLTRVHFFEFPTNRSWLRDSGPIFVRDEGDRTIALDWHFNAWAKYDDWQDDDRLPQLIADVRGMPRIQPMDGDDRIVLEGGSIDVNGNGLLLTTEECLLSDVQQRNPPFDRQDYEDCFSDWFGIEKTLWLGRGIAGDDTHGHVDDIARFVNRNTIVAVEETDPADANYAPLQENLERLRGFTDRHDSKLDIVPLPMPRRIDFDDQRLPASYANFYIADGTVLVPTFNDPADRVALGLLGELFPDRTVMGIHSVDLVLGLGTLHCLSQQEPA